MSLAKGIRRALKQQEEPLLKRLVEGLVDGVLDLKRMVKNAYKRLFRGFYYAINLNDDVDYDSNGLYKVIFLKLQLMEKEMLGKGHCLWTSQEKGKLYKSLKEARFLAKRLYTEINYSNNYDAVVKECGHRPLEWEESGTLFNGEMTYRMKKNPNDKKYTLAYRKDEAQRHQEHERLFHILNKYLRHWWD